MSRIRCGWGHHLKSRIAHLKHRLHMIPCDSDEAIYLAEELLLLKREFMMSLENQTSALGSEDQERRGI